MAPHPPIDHYEALRLSPDATSSQIRSSYHRLARELHPDRRRRRNRPGVVKGGDDGNNTAYGDAEDHQGHDADADADGPVDHANYENEDADERFRRVQDAYECLIDPRRRQEYDDILKWRDDRARSRRKKAVPLEASECRWKAAVEEEEGEGRPSSVGSDGIRPTGSGQLEEDDEPHVALVYTCRCGEDLYPLEDYALEDDGHFLDCPGCSAVYNVSFAVDMLPVPPPS